MAKFGNCWAIPPFLAGVFFLFSPHAAIVSSGFGLNISQHYVHEIIGLALIGFGIWIVQESGR